MYAFAERNADNAVIIFRFDEIDQAIRVLQKQGINVIAGEKLYNL
jgi:hypothetical protein